MNQIKFLPAWDEKSWGLKKISFISNFLELADDRLPRIMLNVDGTKLCPNLNAAVANSLLTRGSNESKYKFEWLEVNGIRPNDVMTFSPTNYFHTMERNLF